MGSATPGAIIDTPAPGEPAPTITPSLVAALVNQAESRARPHASHRNRDAIRNAATNQYARAHCNARAN